MGRSVATVCLLLYDFRRIVKGVLRRTRGPKVSAKPTGAEPSLLRVGIELDGKCGKELALQITADFFHAYGRPPKEQTDIKKNKLVSKKTIDPVSPGRQLLP